MNMNKLSKLRIYSPAGVSGRSLRVIACFVAVLTTSAAVKAQTPVTNGYRDFAYDSLASSTPTGEKPESKLWWNDGYWWGGLYNSTANAYHIYRFDPSTQTWLDQGTQVDDRDDSKGDYLWDASNLKLYVSSHMSTSTGVATTDSTKWGRLYRFSYNPLSKTYSLDSGFPVQITRGQSEILVLAKDSAGTLWVTYVENNQVMVNHSTTSDTAWGTPYILPVGSSYTSVTSDDISSVIAYGGNKIGILWSNQNASKDYFSIHTDGAPDTAWNAPETALPTPNSSGAWADDHINLKTDSTGRIFAAVKTSFTSSSSPLLMLLVRTTDAVWHSYTYATVSDNNTRPIVVLDEADDLLYMFATSSDGGGWILYKTSPMSNISFATSAGTPIIKSSTNTAINNVTTMKQNVSAATGIVVMASDANSRYYLHNFIIPGSSGPFPPTISSFTPSTGPVGTPDTITGTNLSGAGSVTFNGTPASGFVVNSDTQISATVPTGATSGRIAVTTPGGSASSSDSFIVITTPSITSFSPTLGSAGTTVTVNGASFTGTTAVAFNGTNATAFTVLSDNRLTAVVPSGATSGPIRVTNAIGTGTSAKSFEVGTVFKSTADTYVSSAKPTTNYGTASSLRARPASNHTTNNTYLRFNVNGLTSPLTSVAVAKLRLYVTTSTSSITNAYTTSDSWAETGTTWNNAPAAGTVVGSTGSAPSGTWMEISIAPTIFIANGNYDFELTETGSGSGVVWSSREGGNAPQLFLSCGGICQ